MLVDAHNYGDQEAALDKAIRHVQGGTSSSRLIELPSEAASISAIRRILALPDNAPVEATTDELRVFEKLYCLMSMKNPKWRSVGQVESPLDGGEGESDAIHRLMSRLPKAQDADDQDNPMNEHNEFVQWLYACVPEPERISFNGLLRPINASERLGTTTASGLLPVTEAGGWHAVKACQDEIYHIAGRIKRRHAVPEGRFTPEDVEAQDITERLFQFDAVMLELPWLHLPSPHDVPRTSLFARLLLRVSFNRFLCVELGMDRLAIASAKLQSDVLQVLTDAGYASIGDLIRRFQCAGGVDHLAMVNHARLGSADSKRRVTPTLGQIIDKQAELILESCSRSEFEGDTVSANLMRDPVATKAVAWLLLTQAALTGAKILSEDPSVHTAKVRLISQRSALATRGQAMMLRRRAISSILVSGQVHSLSIRRLRQQVDYAQAIRLRCRNVLIKAFGSTGVHAWQRIFDHFGLDQAIALQPTLDSAAKNTF